MFTAQVRHFTYAVAFLTAVGCGSNSATNAPSAANPGTGSQESVLAQAEMPAVDKVGAIDFNTIPNGTYTLIKIQNKRISTDPEQTNFAASHALNKPGEFEGGVDKTSFYSDFKGLTKNLKDGEYHYAYEEINVPVEVVSDGVNAKLGKTHYYYNKVRTDWDKLSWAADPNDKTRGTAYMDIFLKGVRGADNVYTYNFGFVDVQARGVVYFEGQDLKAAIERVTTKGTYQTKRVVIFTLRK